MMTQLSHPSRETKTKVIAAIPCFNTEPFISDVVAKAKKYVDQVVVIDDGSHDGTADAARAAGAEVISHSTNRGYGEAIKSCFEAAKRNATDVLVILDGDGQHNPDEIPQLLRPILRDGMDLVIGSRFLGKQHNMPRYRKFGIQVITLLCNIGSEVKVTDAQSGFRAYNRKLLDSILLSEKGMGVSVEVLIKAMRAGLNIKEVAISCIYRHASSTLNPLRHGLAVALIAIKHRLRTRHDGSLAGTQ